MRRIRNKWAVLLILFGVIVVTSMQGVDSINFNVSIVSYWNMSSEANEVNVSYNLSVGGGAPTMINTSSCINGNCTLFDSNDWYTIDTDLGIAAGSNWTFNAWVDEFYSVNMREVIGSAESRGYFSLSQNTDDAWVQNVNGWEKWDNIGYVGNWMKRHMFTLVTIENGTCRIYINATYKGKVTLDGPSSQVEWDLIGEGDNLPWNGTIDEIGIWKVAMTGAEVTALYENYTAGESYPFHKGIGNSPPNAPTLNFPADNASLHYNYTGIVTLDITITDPNADDMNVTFYNATGGVICNNNTNIASGTQVTCGWSGRSNTSNNEWHANVTDGNSTTTGEGWNFTIQENRNPSITQNRPIDGHIFQAGTSQVTLNVTYTDSDGDHGNVTFVNNATGTTLCENLSTANNTQVTCRWTGLANNTEYCWYGHAIDTGTNASTADTVRCFEVDRPNSDCWWYRLNITFTDSEFSSHTLQPVTYDISGLNGTNKEILKVLHNDSGTWRNESWEWHHERYNLTDNFVYHNHTIRFLVNATNNTEELDYWIVSCNNNTAVEFNRTLFLWYDGFERGTTTGWNDDGCTYNLSQKRAAGGNYSLNYTAGAHNEVYWDFNFTLDNTNSYICLFTQIDSNANGHAFPIMLQNNTPTYDGSTWNRFETWYYDKGDQAPDYRDKSINYYNYTEEYRGTTEVFEYEQWYSWCWKEIDTVNINGTAHFWLDNVDTEPAGSDWYVMKNKTRWYNNTDTNTFNPIEADQIESRHWFEEVDGISISSVSGATGFEMLVDELYLSVGVDFNMYNITPTINRFAAAFVPDNATPTIVVNSPTNGTDFANGTTWVVLNVTINDTDAMNLTFYNSSDGILHNNESIPSGELVYIYNWTGLPSGTHIWYANITDGTTMNSTGNMRFVINHSVLTFTLHYPPNGSTNIPANPNLNITINCSYPSINVTIFGSYNISTQITPNSSSCTNGWNAAFPCSQVNDTNWSSFGRAGTDNVTYFYANYSKPTYATNASMWEVQHGWTGVGQYPHRNLSFLYFGGCWNQSQLILRMVSNNSDAASQYNSMIECYNGSAWQLMTQNNATGQVNSADLYEEEMHWVNTGDEFFSIYTENNVPCDSSVNYTWENRSIGYTYNWYVNALYNSSEEFNSSTWEFTIAGGALDNCSSYSDIALQLFLFDERTRAALYGDIDVVVYSAAQNYTFSDDNVTNMSICIMGSLTTNETLIEYYTTGYEVEDYYLLDTVLTDASTTTVNLYDLNTSESQSHEITVLDSSYNEIDEAYIRVHRYYPPVDQYILVEMAKTDNFGQGLVHLVLEDVFYYFTVESDGTIIYTSDPGKMYCSAAPCELEFVTTDDVLPMYSYLDDIPNFNYNLSYNYTTSILRLSYVMTSGTLSYVRMSTHRGGYASAGNEISQTNSSAASGTLLLNMSSTTGVFFVDGVVSYNPTEELVGFLGVAYENFASAFSTFGTEGLLLAIFIIITIVLMMAYNPKLALVATVVGLLSAYFLGFIQVPWTAIMSVVMIAILILYVLMRGDRYE